MFVALLLVAAVAQLDPAPPDVPDEPNQSFLIISAPPSIPSRPVFALKFVSQRTDDTTPAPPALAPVVTPTPQAVNTTAAAPPTPAKNNSVASTPGYATFSAHSYYYPTQRYYMPAPATPMFAAPSYTYAAAPGYTYAAAPGYTYAAAPGYTYAAAPGAGQCVNGSCGSAPGVEVGRRGLLGAIFGRR